MKINSKKGKGGGAIKCDFCGKDGHKRSDCYWQTVEWYGVEYAKIRHSD